MNAEKQVDKEWARSTGSSEQLGSVDGDSEPYSAISPRQRVGILVIVCFANMVAPLASLMYTPALPAIAESLHVSTAQINLTITTFLIFQGITPSIWSSIADSYGRRLVCVITLFITLGSSIGLCLANNFASVVALRGLNATGSASMQALGTGIIRDIIPPRLRGGYMGWYNAGIAVGVAFGPVLGGLLAQYTTYRGIFYFLFAWSAVGFISIALLLPETLHSIVGNGSVAPPAHLRPPIKWLTPSSDSSSHSTKAELSARPPRQKVNILGPLLIMRWPDVISALLFVGIFYTIWSNHIIATSTLYSSVYGLSEAKIGLTYLSSGVGSLVGSVVIGWVMDHDYEAQLQKEFKDRPSEKNDQSKVKNVAWARLRSMWYHAPLFLAGIVVFGWTVRSNVHIALSIIAMFFIGWLDCCVLAVYSTLMMDLFEDGAAMSSASVNIIRCALGAVGSSTIQQMIEALGTEWAFTTLALIGLAIMPLVWFQVKFGPKYQAIREACKTRSLKQDQSAV